MNPSMGLFGCYFGIILNDAAGLDMKHYLQENFLGNGRLFNHLDKRTGQLASLSDLFLDKATPFLILRRRQNYPSIKVANSRFVDALHSYQPNVTPIHLNKKKHVCIFVQWPCNTLMRLLNL
jgi:hypothetical protein